MVINLNEMNTKELKAMAKELSVKNWWNLKKVDLISEIAITIGDKEDAGEEVDVEAIAEASQNAPESTEEPEANNNEAENEEASESDSKSVKKPSLKIKELTFYGRTQTIKDWAAELEMPWPTLYDRVNRNGWTVEEALTIPLGGRRKKGERA